jgi:Icc-related predicted phosphoesterase
MAPFATEYWIAIGDMHNEVEKLADLPGLRQAAGVIVSGDLTIHGRTAQARKVMEAVQAYNSNIFAQYGNMDHAEVCDYLQDSGWNIHCAARVLAPARDGLPEVGIMGVGGSTPTPFGTPSEYADEQIGAWLEQTYALAKSFSSLVLVAHTPPYGTAVDRIGSGAHVGSPAVRAFIERTQPEVCVTGHIHESRALDRLGKTILVNPGAFGAGGYARITRNASGLDVALLSA